MYRTHKLSALALALAGLSTSPAFAAADEDRVVVTASRFAEADPKLPANISVITREDIRNNPTLSLPELLRDRAGVMVRSLYGNMGEDANVDLRGFGDTAGSNTLILVDGQRMNPIDMGSVTWAAIPLASVQRVEIIRGSGTVLFGDRASGGVINIITDKSGRPQASVTGTVGSYGYRAGDGHLAGGSGDLYYNLVAHHAAGDGWRKNSGAEQTAFSGRTGVRLGEKGDVFVDFAAYKDRSQLPSYLLTPDYRVDPTRASSPRDSQQKEGYRIRPGIAYALSHSLSLEAEVAVEHERLRSDYVSFGSVSTRSHDNVSLTPRLRWQHGLGSLASETVVGVDYYTGRVRADYTTFANQHADQTSTALYLQNSTTLTPNWSLTVGGRHQRMDQNAHQDAYPAYFYDAVDGGGVSHRDAYDLGLTYTEGAWRAYGKAGTTFRFANADELFGYDNVTGNPIFAGNLKPQHGTIQELGTSFRLDAAAGRLSVYRMALKDEIGYDATAGFFGNNVNYAPTRRKGLEAELDWRLTASLKSRFAYAYTDAEFREGSYAGKSIPLVPTHKATAELTWKTGTLGSYTAVANYVGRRWYSGDLSNSLNRMDAYTTLDLQGSWTVGTWALTAKLVNALDRRYSAFGGYSVYKSDYYYYPADGRSVFLSAKYDFK